MESAWHAVCWQDGVLQVRDGDAGVPVERIHCPAAVSQHAQDGGAPAPHARPQPHARGGG